MNLTGSLCKYKHKILYCILLIPFLFILNINKYANISSDIIYGNQDYITSLEYPDLSEGKIFKPHFTKSHKRLFYTGKLDNKFISGYYNSKHFLEWQKNSFTPLDSFKQEYKSILDVSSGPINNSIVLSYVDDVGQVLSSSSDGETWNSEKVNTSIGSLEHLINTNINMLPLVLAYGSRNTTFLVSSNGLNWHPWLLPNPCESDPNCYFYNDYLNSVNNGYVLLQSKTLEDIKTNQIYFTSNLTNWYNYSLPFEKDNIQKSFKAQNETLLISAINENAEHKLWLSQNYKDWDSFDLPTQAIVLDANIDKFNNIVLLLNYKNEGSPDFQVLDDDHDNTQTETINNSITKLVIINQDTKELTKIQTFTGLVNNLDWFEDKLYLSGDFINPSDDKHVALVVVNN